MIRLNLFMIWFLHFLSLLSVVCSCCYQNLSSQNKVVLVYTVSTLFLQRMLYTYQFISFENILLCTIFHDYIPMT